MENILLDQWIELSKGRSAILREISSIGWNAKILELTVKSAETVSSKKLIVQGRQVADGDGNLVDFGTAYPYATQQGKETITRKFIYAFI